MDEETKAYLDSIRLERTNHLDGMMVRINDQFERLLDDRKAVRQDTDNTRGHVLCGLQGNLTLSQRITKIEDATRRRSFEQRQHRWLYNQAR